MPLHLFTSSSRQLTISHPWNRTGPLLHYAVSLPRKPRGKNRLWGRHQTSAGAEGKGVASKAPAVQNVCLSVACFCGQPKPWRDVSLPARSTVFYSDPPQNIQDSQQFSVSSPQPLLFVAKPERWRPHGRPRPRWEDNIKTDLRKIGWEGVDPVAGFCEHGTVMNLRVP
jgi:hypothetical protein